VFLKSKKILEVLLKYEKNKTKKVNSRVATRPLPCWGGCMATPSPVGGGCTTIPFTMLRNGCAANPSPPLGMVSVDFLFLVLFF
jgi:hypothetical protein